MKCATTSEPPSLQSLGELTDDALTGRLRITQRKHGHRYSLDDVLTAYVAARARPNARRCLDLGCGVGSVLLMLADKLPQASLVGLEAQDVSYRLVLTNIVRNGLCDRVRAEQGDLRDAANLDRLAAGLAADGGGFELVTGTPPYMPAGTGTASPDSQRAHARVELRGGVEEYLLAAGRMLAPSGVCVICARSDAHARVERGAQAAGLKPVARLETLAMRGRSTALFTVHTLMRAEDAADVPFTLAAPFVARDELGARTPEANALRRFFGHQVYAEDPSPRTRARRAFMKEAS